MTPPTYTPSRCRDSGLQSTSHCRPDPRRVAAEQWISLPSSYFLAVPRLCKSAVCSTSLGSAHRKLGELRVAALRCGLPNVPDDGVRMAATRVSLRHNLSHANLKLRGPCDCGWVRAPSTVDEGRVVFATSLLRRADGNVPPVCSVKERHRMGVSGLRTFFSYSIAFSRRTPSAILLTRFARPDATPSCVSVSAILQLFHN